MAMNIPLPGANMETFFKGGEYAQSMIDSMLQNRQKNEALQQQKLEAQQMNQYRMGSLKEETRHHDQTNAYNMGHLGIMRMAENRAQQLLPGLLQKAKDEHGISVSESKVKELKANIAQHEYNQIMNSINGQQGQDQEQPQQPQQYDKLASTMPSMFGSNENLGYTPIPGRQPGIQPGMQQPNQQGQPSQSQRQQQPEIPEPPKEFIVKKGRPGYELQDKMAGSSNFGNGKGLKNTHGKDYIDTEYPSGKIVRTMIPKGEDTSDQKLDDKMKRSIQAANEKADYKDNLKQSGAVKKNITSVFGMADDVIKMKEIFNRRKNLTGPSVHYSKKLGLSSDKDIGKLMALTGDYQGKVSAYNTARPGVGSLKWAATVKPDIYNQQSLNEGMVDEGLEKYRDQLKSEGREYKRLTGEDHPEIQSKIDKIENAMMPPQEDLEHTAKLRGITVEEVKKQYKARRFPENE